jgi:putative transposase
MRTIKRYSRVINKRKWAELCKLARLYRDEKNLHLSYFNQDSFFAAEKNERVRRDSLVEAKYEPSTGLQARQWKTALTESYDTINKNWCALTKTVKHFVAKHKKNWTENEMHYGYWTVLDGKRLASVVDGRAPIPTHFSVSYDERTKVTKFLKRIARRKRGFRPLARSFRSFILDANMYKIVKNKETQYIKIMGLIAGKRIAVPLTGFTDITGNIKVILDFSKRRIEVHFTHDVASPLLSGKGTVGLDAGITEVFTDDENNIYGKGFGKLISKASKYLKRTGSARNKLYALKKKSSKHKADRITRLNLGKEKLNKRRNNTRIYIEQQISHAVREVVKVRNPAVIVSEKLDIRGKAKSKEMSRQVNSWMRGSLEKRLDFLALVEGFHHKQVNPAYTSQMCLSCLFVDKDNRKGDIFKCLHCGYIDYSDHVAAVNLRARENDPDITIYTPKSVVKAILLNRFIASLERNAETSISTVSGRTGIYSNVMPERISGLIKQ